MAYNRLLLSSLVMALLITAPDAWATHQRSAASGSYRIAIDADGNYNDPDDWAATPATLALIARRGLQSKLIHYSFSNSLGANSWNMYRQMQYSTLNAADQFGFARSRFFDIQTRLSGAITNLKNQINASSSSNRLYILAAGPMEFLWRSIKAADPSKRAYVTVISHSRWNNTRIVRPQMVHTAEDVKALGVRWVQIPDQNQRLHTGSQWSPWTWLRTKSQSRMQWIYQRMQATGKPDISDAGLAYYLLYGDQYGTPDKLQRAFGGWN